MKKKDLARSKAQKIQSYLDVFTGSEAGQEVLLDLMEQGFILQPTFDSNGMQADRNEGKRELVLYIMDMITYNVEDIMKILDTTSRRKGDKNEEEREEFDFFRD